MAFPGWTLPGVMMGGAAQSLLVTQRVLPGRRVVLAGVGPLQLKVASQLVDAGATVVEILEASSKPPVSMENALRSLGHWGKMREGMTYWMKLKKARVPYHHSQVPVRALGDGATGSRRDRPGGRAMAGGAGKRADSGGRYPVSFLWILAGHAIDPARGLPARLPGARRRMGHLA